MIRADLMPRDSNSSSESGLHILITRYAYGLGNNFEITWDEGKDLLLDLQRIYHKGEADAIEEVDLSAGSEIKASE